LNNLSADNHYVPAIYLKSWCNNSDNKIWRYNLLSPHENVPLWKPSSPEGISFHRHLYTRIVSTNESDEIEKWFNSEFETPVSTSIKKVTSDSQLTREDWTKLIKFLALQDVRTPARLAEILKRSQETLPELMNSVLTNTVQELEKFKNSGQSPIITSSPYSNYMPIKITKELIPDEDYAKVGIECVVGRGLWLHTIKHLLTNTIIKLLNHKWTILCSPIGINWLTSDDPVIKLNYHSPNKYDFGGGWGSNGTEIFLPLSPRHLLYTRVGSRPLTRGTVLPRDQAIIFQRLIVEHAHRYVFSNTQDLFVHQSRPRKVNLEEYKNEKMYWKSWHEQNTAAEQNLQP
jgi:Protein of unknown function (DUF4238)